MIAAAAFIAVGYSDNSNAGEIFTEDEITYEISSGTNVTVIAGSPAYSGDIVIPSTVTHTSEYTVTAIGEAFRNDGVTSVSIPSTVVSIDPLAFFNCDTLVSITVAAENTAFSSVDGILFNKAGTSLMLYPASKEGAAYTIPASVTSIADYGFQHNQNLALIEIPATVQSTGEESFSTSNITSVTIKGETAIGERSFYKCDRLTVITISGKATLGAEAFTAMFLETNETTPIEELSNLPGFSYILGDEGFVKQYNVFFDKNGGSADTVSQAVKYNTAITMPAYSGTKTGFTFGGWSYDGNTYAADTTVDKIDGDMTFTAVWNGAAVKHTITFMNGDETYATSEVIEGSDIAAPAGTPVKASTAEFDYTFVRWDGLFEGMKATCDQTFYAAFGSTLKTIDITKDEVVIDTKGAAETTVPDSMIQQIKTAGDEGKDTAIYMINGAIIIDDVSASALPNGDKDISIYKVQPPTPLMQELMGRPVFAVQLGDVHEFEGELTISLKYTLNPLDDPDNVVIWYLTSEENYEKIPATYADGYVTFTVNHLSTFAIMFEEPSGGNSDNTALIVAIVIVVIAVAGVGAFFFLKKKQQ